MDAHTLPVDQISIYQTRAPVVSRRASPAPDGESVKLSIPGSHSTTSAPPFVAHREGRFFIIQQIPASLAGSPPRWRCVLATASQGYVSHRDFGPHDADYVLAVQMGREFEEEGRVDEVFP